MHNFPKHMYEMTEAELIRELGILEPRVRELYARLDRGELKSKDLFELNRSDIRATMIRAELDARCNAACV